MNPDSSQALNSEATEYSKLEEIAKGVFALTYPGADDVHDGFGANQGFAVLEDSVLVFDTGFSTAHASLLDSAIRKVTDRKVRYVVNSHDHSDHVFGNSYFVQRYGKTGLSIVSHATCKQKIQSKGPTRLKAYRARDAKLRSMLSAVSIRAPNTTYPDTSLKLNIEGTEFIFVHPAQGAHTLGDSILCIPKRNTMFAGDVYWNQYLPNLEDANIDGWIEYLDNIDLETYRRILPGHGGVSGRRDLIGFKEYMEEVRARLSAVAHGESDRSKLRRCFDHEGTEKWKMRQIVDMNVSALFGDRY